MKVTLKPLTGAGFQVDCEGSETVAALKAKVAAQGPAFPLEGLVLIYKGTILADDATIDSASYGATSVLFPSSCTVYASQNSERCHLLHSLDRKMRV